MIQRLKNWYHLALAYFASAWYRHPSRVLTVVGVTGTKGKSTVVELLSAIFEAAGFKTAFYSSVRIKAGDAVEINRTGNSMPGRGRLEWFLRRAADAGCRYTFIEVTSQGVVQHRHRFIEWDGGIFTNLAPEHIESHGSFEKYREAKLGFFRILASSRKTEKIAIINREDPSAPLFLEAAASTQAFLVPARERGEELRLSGAWITIPVNLENAALVAAYAEARGVPRDVICRALDEFPGVPGRMEYVQHEPFAVVVDYAHTPDSLEKVYKYLKTNRYKSKAKLICVLGAAGGGRDKWKRPKMGSIAAQYCDDIILTNEDPYNETQDSILEDIERGIRTNPSNQYPSVLRILDRRDALKKAISIAQPGDVVVATGKGSETSIHLANKKSIPWNERKVMEELLELP